jgi:5-formyltetrahydrofolate cyclo-ligase
VGFDEHGNRLGQGGGFYDHYLSHYPEKKSVTVIGVAYEMQKLDSVPTHSWDKPLDAVITEQHTY